MKKLYGQQEQEDLEESMREAFRQRDERLKKKDCYKKNKKMLKKEGVKSAEH